MRPVKRTRRAVEIGCLALAFCAAVWLLGGGIRRYLCRFYPDQYGAQVTAAAEENGLSPSLLMGMIYTESHFDPTAHSSAGAVGLMQLTASTFDWAQMRRHIPEDERLSPDLREDPDINIRYGSYVLALLREEFPEEDTALAAYNAGIGHVREWLSDSRYSADGVTLTQIPFEETREYVRRVRAAQEMYRRLYGYD